MMASFRGLRDQIGIQPVIIRGVVCVCVCVSVFSFCLFVCWFGCFVVFFGFPRCRVWGVGVLSSSPRLFSPHSWRPPWPLLCFGLYCQLIFVLDPYDI